MQLFLVAAFAMLQTGVIADEHSYDVLVYGATPAGVLAAAAASSEGASVLLLDPRGLIGGAMSGGLANTDLGTTTSVLGGLTARFFELVAAWYHETGPLYLFEPKVAEAIFTSLTQTPNITTLLSTRIVAAGMSGTAIPSITSVNTSDGRVFAAKVYIDCSYEGFLLPLTGVSYTWGREAASTYNESAGGVSATAGINGTYTLQGQLFSGVNPFVNGTSGALLPFVTPPPGTLGSGDNRTQAYIYRVTLTTNASNMVQPWLEGPPEGYDPANFELHRRAAIARNLSFFGRGGALQNEKFDCNNQWLDFCGTSYDYPLAVALGDWPAQQAVWQAYKDAILGVTYMWANDPTMPPGLHADMRRVGLPADEYISNGNFPPQLYVREALRLVGDYVMTQLDREVSVNKSDSIAMGAYSVDVLHVSRYASISSSNSLPTVLMEGGIQAPSFLPAFLSPFQVPYRIMLPKRLEVSNLLVPVAASASHVAFGAIRLEPTWMPLGEAAGVAAAQASAPGVAVQDLDVAALQERLRQRGQVLEL